MCVWDESDDDGVSGRIPDEIDKTCYKDFLRGWNFSVSLETPRDCVSNDE